MVEMSSPVSRQVAGHRHGRVPRAVREQQLLEVAEHVFAKQGYQGTSIEDIARAAGVTRPIVYDHFGSKDGVYLACVRRARSELERSVADAASASDDPAQQLWAGISAYFEFVERHGRAWDVLFGQGTAVAGPAAKEVFRQRSATVRVIADLLARAAPDVDAEAIEAFAHALSGSGELLAKWWRVNPHLTRDQVAGYHMAFAWHGLDRLVAGTAENAPESLNGAASADAAS